MIEKEMVNDALNNINSALTSYASAISQSENTELRNTLIQMRNQAEQSQYDLYTIAKNLNYYAPAQQASKSEISKVKSEVSGCGCSSSSKGSCGCSSSSSKGSCGCSSSSSQSSCGCSSNSSQNSSGYSSSSSQGLLNNVDEQTKKALQAPPKSTPDSFS